jgi:hypothetical protein
MVGSLQQRLLVAEDRILEAPKETRLTETRLPCEINE